MSCSASLQKFYCVSFCFSAEIVIGPFVFRRLLARPEKNSSDWFADSLYPFLAWEFLWSENFYLDVWRL